MNLAILADTHMPRGDRRLPQECVRRLERADLIIHAGDLVALSVLEELRGMGPPVVAVHGNVDDAEVRRALPERAEVDLDGVSVGVIHDAGPARGRLGRLRSRFPNADAVVFGHSHMPSHATDDEEGFQIFNPGSPTERRRAPARTMGQARIRKGRLAFQLIVLG